MLEGSLARLNTSSPEDKQVAELLALTSLKTQLEEDLIPADEALATAKEHRTEQSEEWTRAMCAALAGLDELKRNGLKLTKA